MRNLLIMGWLCLLFACQPASAPNDFLATDISYTHLGNRLSLTDHTGRPRTLADFNGKVIALFFGYTHCPDVCPTTMSDMKKVMKQLGEQSDQLQVLFVTLDPERDTQQVLSQYVPGFDPRFVGLTGSNAAIATTVNDFKIFSNKVSNHGHSGYTIDHSAGIYIFDQHGKIRLYVNYGTKPTDIANDIKKLLKQ